MSQETFEDAEGAVCILTHKRLQDFNAGLS